MDNKEAIDWLRVISATQTQSSHASSLEIRKEALYIAIKAIKELEQYKNAEEQGFLLRLDSKDELIEVLASKLLNEQFGACYMCKNPMKNITLDGVHNGCDGNCNLSEENTVDDFIKKIVRELGYTKQNEAEKALKQMGE